MEKLNKVFVVGTLREVSTKKGTTEQGKNYIAGSFKVESEKSLIEFKFYSNELTEKGTLSKRYTNYLELENFLNLKVKVSGDISGRVFYQISQGQSINFNELNASFVNLAKETEQDTATFEYFGFVTKPLYERLNEKEELVAYEIEIGQANYREDNMQIIKFTVNPESKNIVREISNAYTKDKTVSILGKIYYIPFETTKTEEVAFGEPIVKVFNSVRKMFVITGGNKPVVDETAYTKEQIGQLQSAYNDFLEKIEKEAKEDVQSGKAVTVEKPANTSNINRLL